MNTEQRTEVLSLLDFERQTIGYPEATRFSNLAVIREISADGKDCEIVYSRSSEDEVDLIIKQQIQTARKLGYGLEWKVYGHDRPNCLGDRLIAAGFEAGDKEAFMVFLANHEALGRFGAGGSDIRRVTSIEGLKDYQIIQEEVLGESCEKEIARYGLLLENHPNNMSVYIAYVGGEPAAGGRVYFHEDSCFAALYGGQTREQFRESGLFLQIVAARIREALDRGIVNICVDALPTSEPILRKRGFEIVTHTQPFYFSE